MTHNEKIIAKDEIKVSVVCYSSQQFRGQSQELHDPDLFLR